MTRVLVIAPTPFFSDRGCHVRIYEEAIWLLERGHQVSILTYPIGADPAGLTLHRIKSIVKYEKLEAGPNWKKVWLDAALLARGASLCRRERPDLIHAHLHEGALVGWVLGRVFGLPVVFDYQGSLTGESTHHGFIREGGALAGLFGLVENLIDRLPDRLIASSNAMVEALRAKGRRAEAVIDAVDFQRFGPGPPDQRLKTSLGLPSDRPILAYLGAMSEYQGVDILLDAFRLVLAGGAEAHLLMMGYPEGRYRERAERMGISSRVTFTGRLDYFRAAEHLRLGDLAMAPKVSRTESNGKVLNYMACGLPVVAFDLPMNRELLGDWAFWARHSPDPAAGARGFGAAIVRALADASGAALVGRRAREEAETRFSGAAQFGKLEAIYRELLGEAGKR